MVGCLKGDSSRDEIKQTLSSNSELFDGIKGIGPGRTKAAVIAEINQRIIKNVGTTNIPKSEDSFPESLNQKDGTEFTEMPRKVNGGWLVNAIVVILSLIFTVIGVNFVAPQIGLDVPPFLQINWVRHWTMKQFTSDMVDFDEFAREQWNPKDVAANSNFDDMIKEVIQVHKADHEPADGHQNAQSDDKSNQETVQQNEAEAEAIAEALRQQKEQKEQIQQWKEQRDALQQRYDEEHAQWDRVVNEAIDRWRQHYDIINTALDTSTNQDIFRLVDELRELIGREKEYYIPESERVIRAIRMDITAVSEHVNQRHIQTAMIDIGDGRINKLQHLSQVMHHTSAEIERNLGNIVESISQNKEEM